MERTTSALEAARALATILPLHKSHSELCQTLLALQDDLFTLKSYQHALRSGVLAALERIQELENDISQLKRHRHPIEQFECCQLPAGTFVYRRRDMQDTQAPYGYFCPHCLHQRGAAPLEVVQGRQFLFLECPSCTVRFTYRPLKKKHIRHKEPLYRSTDGLIDS